MRNSIKNSLLICIISLAINTQIRAQTAPLWQIDKDHTFINFSVNHFFSLVNGKFNDFEGKIYFDPKNLKGSRAEFTVNVESINTDNFKRDTKLKSPDFFDAKKFPKITFKSSEITKKSAIEYLVKGKLTIRDVTRTVKLPLKVKGEMVHPMNKNKILLGLSLSYKLNRNDYDVGKGDWATSTIVGKDVDVSINMELNRDK